MTRSIGSFTENEHYWVIIWSIKRFWTDLGCTLAVTAVLTCCTYTYFQALIMIYNGNYTEWSAIWSEIMRGCEII